MTSWIRNTDLSRRLPKRSNAPDWKHLKESSYDGLFSDKTFGSFIRIKSKQAVLAMDHDDTESSRDLCRKAIKRATVEDISELDHFLKKEDGSYFTILSMDRENQMFPITATGEVIQRIFEHYQVQPEFAPIFTQCSSPSNPAWEAVDGLSAGMSPEGTFTVQYRLRYFEENGRRSPGESPWSVRQIGVHHKFSPKGRTGHIIFLHPVMQSDFQSTLEESGEELRLLECCIGKPLGIHCMLFGHIFGSWKSYLDAQGQELSILTDKVFMMDREKHAGLRFNAEFHCMQQLRHLEERLLPLPALLRCSQNILQSLEELNTQSFESLYVDEETAVLTARTLRFHADTARGQAESIEILLRKISGALSLLVDTLAMQNHAVGETRSKDVLSLAKNSANDRAAVRTITSMILLYLPTTCIATIFGSNFFEFNGQDNSLHVSHHIWTFFITSFCVTTAAIGWWAYVMRKWKVQNDRAADLEASVLYKNQ